MYFDPVSSWLVALIADGIIVANDRIGNDRLSKFHQDCIKQANESLNRDIRNIKYEYGLNDAIIAYEEIERLITSTITFVNGRPGVVVIDMDNQEYIIELLEECSKCCRKPSYKKAHLDAALDAAWYKDAAIEARKRKEQYAIRLEENRIREEKERRLSNIYTFVGILIFIAFLVFCFSE